MTQDLNTWQEIALVAGPAIAALAAFASWASVWQARKLAHEASTPHLQVQKIVTMHGFIGAVVTNAGGGAARGAGIYIAHPPYFAQGALGHGFLFPGETRTALTDIPVTEVETDALVLCRDKNSVPHYWNANEQHRAYTGWRGRPKYRKDIPKVFREFHPAVDTSVLTEVAMSVE